MLRPMLIYSAEKEAGLAESLANHRSVAAYCPILSEKQVPESFKKKHLSTALEALAKKGVEEQYDLYPLYTILATCGWNKNDDVFLRDEVWAARNTPKDKPFNQDHNPRLILGHMTGSWPVDEEYKLIDDDVTVDKLPEKYHLLTSAVIYRHLGPRDEELTKSVAELIEAINDGKKFVSMECLFSNFDYAVATTDGKQGLIKRDESTAWLTKHLRSYGGKGIFENYTVGRALRDFTFSGKGLVDKPANPESIIFNNVEDFNGAFASLQDFKASTTTSVLIEQKLSENIQMAEVSKEQYDAAQAEIAGLRKRLEETKEEQIKAKHASFEASIASLQDEIKALKTELTNTQAAKGESVKALEAAKAKEDELVKKLSEAETKIKEGELATVTAKRVTKLVDVGVESTKAEELAKKFASANDELFDEVVAAYSTAKKVDKTDEEKAAEAKATEEAAKKVASEAAAAEAAKKAKEIEGATVEETDEAALAANAGGESNEALAGLSDFMAQQLAKSKKKN